MKLCPRSPLGLVSAHGKITDKLAIVIFPGSEFESFVRIARYTVLKIRPLSFPRCRCTHYPSTGSTARVFSWAPESKLKVILGSSIVHLASSLFIFKPNQRYFISSQGQNYRETRCIAKDDQCSMDPAGSHKVISPPPALQPANLLPPMSTARPPRPRLRLDPQRQAHGASNLFPARFSSSAKGCSERSRWSTYVRVDSP